MYTKNTQTTRSKKKKNRKKIVISNKCFGFLWIEMDWNAFDVTSNDFYLIFIMNFLDRYFQFEIALGGIYSKYLICTPRRRQRRGRRWWRRRRRRWSTTKNLGEIHNYIAYNIFDGNAYAAARFPNKRDQFKDLRDIHFSLPFCFNLGPFDIH